MDMKDRKPVKVILYRRPELVKNAASFNRNEMLEKMFCSTFPTVIIRPKSTEILSGNRYLRGIRIRIQSYLQIFKLFSIARDKGFNYCLYIFPLDPFTIDPFIDCFIYLITRLLGIRLVTGRNEFPYLFFNGANAIQRFLYRNFLLSWHYKLFDSMFIMTDELIQFYRKHTRRNCYIQKLPMTVDFSRFAECHPTFDEEYIFYAGSLLERKDGVVSLIYAFNQISTKYPGLVLKIAGASPGHTEENKLQYLIDSLELSGKVKLLGSIERNQIPVLMCSAKVLVLARPNSLQAKGGFPTKLGEYLASGRPVIVSKVGEIPALVNEDEVFFIDPDKLVDGLVIQLDYILSNYTEALRVGMKGKKRASQLFSLESNIKNIIKGIESTIG